MSPDLKIQKCPWCGEHIKPKQENARVELLNSEGQRLNVTLGGCGLSVKDIAVIEHNFEQALDADSFAKFEHAISPFFELSDLAIVDRNYFTVSATVDVYEHCEIRWYTQLGNIIRTEKIKT